MRFTNALISSVSTLALLSCALPVSDVHPKDPSVINSFDFVSDPSIAGNTATNCPGTSGYTPQEHEEGDDEVASTDAFGVQRTDIGLKKPKDGPAYDEADQKASDFIKTLRHHRPNCANSKSSKGHPLRAPAWYIPQGHGAKAYVIDDEQDGCDMRASIPVAMTDGSAPADAGIAKRQPQLQRGRTRTFGPITQQKIDKATSGRESTLAKGTSSVPGVGNTGDLPTPGALRGTNAQHIPLSENKGGENPPPSALNDYPMLNGIKDVTNTDMSWLASDGISGVAKKRQATRTKPTRPAKSPLSSPASGVQPDVSIGGSDIKDTLSGQQGDAKPSPQDLLATAMESLKDSGLRGRAIAKRREAVKAANIARTPMQPPGVSLILPDEEDMGEIVKNPMTLTDRLRDRDYAGTPADAQDRIAKRELRSTNDATGSTTETGSQDLGVDNGTGSSHVHRRQGTPADEVIFSVNPVFEGSKR